MSRWAFALTLLCACATTPPPPPTARASFSLQGPWHGELEAGAQRIQIDLVFASADKGLLSVPQQGVRDLPVENVVVTSERVSFESTLPGGQRVWFDGTPRGERVEGKFKQGPATVPFWLARGERPAVPLARNGEGYEEKEVSFENGSIRLAGTLTLPSGKARPPVAVLITGSGPQDRNEDVFGFRVFEALAHELARGGVATLRFDDRGVGQSTGNFLTATTADFATDAEAAVRFLKGRQEVDASRIGLIGHSEGGLVAPLVASRNADVRYVVLLAGPAQSAREILLGQQELISKAEGRPPERIERDLRLSRKALDLLAAGEDLSSLETELGDVCDEESGGKCPSRADFVKAKRYTMESPWFRSFLAYDPKPALAKVRCPVLALGGSLDLQVPSEANLAIIRRILSEAKNPKVSVEEIAGMNHVLQAAKTGAVSEYAKLPKVLEPKVPARILAFVGAL